MTSQNQWANILRARAFHKNVSLSYYLRASIWIGLKEYIPVVIENLAWQIGNGEKIKFWHDQWLSKSLVEILDIPDQMQQNLTANLKDFMVNGRLHFPESIIQRFPVIAEELNKIHIPLVSVPDQMKWIKSDTGDLTFKEAYIHLHPVGQQVPWHKLL